MTLKEYLNANDRYARAGGMQVASIRPDAAEAVMQVAEMHLNGAGVCQGGALYTLADLAVAAVMNSSGCTTVGIENTMTYHRPAMPGDRLTARATMTCDHRRLPLCKVEVRNDKEELIASGTFLGYRKNEKMADFEALM